MITFPARLTVIVAALGLLVVATVGPAPASASASAETFGHDSTVTQPVEPIPVESEPEFGAPQVVVDYVDPVAYAKLRGATARIPDFVSGAGSLPESRTPDGPGAAKLRAHVDDMTYAGRWPGTAELIDHAGEGDIGWAQWLFHGPNGDFAGWSLLRPTGTIRDFFDTVSAHHQSTT